MHLYWRKKKTRKAVKAKAKAEKCATKWCRNQRAVKVTRHRLADGRVKIYRSQLLLCWKCRSHRLKEKHPHTYVLNMLRHSARKRKLPFTLTVAQFQQFCAETRYLELRGNAPNSLTIDRKNVNEGYHIWNIQVLSHAENSAQGAANAPRDVRGAATEEDLDSQPEADTDPF